MCNIHFSRVKLLLTLWQVIRCPAAEKETVSRPLQSDWDSSTSLQWSCPHTNSKTGSSGSTATGKTEGHNFTSLFISTLTLFSLNMIGLCQRRPNLTISNMTEYVTDPWRTCIFFYWLLIPTICHPINADLFCISSKCLFSFLAFHFIHPFHSLSVSSLPHKWHRWSEETCQAVSMCIWTN